MKCLTKQKLNTILTGYNRDDFFNSIQLSKIFNMGSTKNIREKLLKAQNVLPKNAVVNLIHRHPCVCLHKDYVLDFCNMEPLLPVTPSLQKHVLEAAAMFDAKKSELGAQPENQK